MATSILCPFEFPRGPNRVPQRNAWRRDKQSPDESIGVVEPDLPRVRDGRDESGMRNSSPSIIGAGHRIRNHEERKQQQRAALQLMRPYGPPLAEVLDAKRERGEIEREEGPADVAAARALRHQHAQHDDPAPDRKILTPLARRNPGAGKKSDCEDDAEGRGIEQMLFTKPENRLRGDRGGSGDRMREQIVRAQQQRQAERSDNRAAQ